MELNLIELNNYINLYLKIKLTSKLDSYFLKLKNYL